MADSEKSSGSGKAVFACCGGIIIIAIILVVIGSFGDSPNEPNKSVNLVLDGKSFTVHNLTENEIKNIKGNNTSTIDFNNGYDGRAMFMVSTATPSTTILNELDPRDNITNVTTDGMTYQNIIFYDGGPSMTVFKTSDGVIYEINYYNGNDFLFDYQDFGKQMNK